MGAVFTIDTSAVGVTGVEIELVLLLGSGSLTPLGRPIVAVLVIVPVAPGATVPLIVITTLAPEGSVGISPVTLLPDTPTLDGQTAPLLALPQDAVIPVMAAGTASAKLVPLAALGPALPIRKV